MMNDEELSTIVEFSEDLSTAERPNPLPAGEYAGEIREVQPKVSQKGNKYANISIFVAPEQYPVDYKDGNPDGTILSYMGMSLEDTKQARYRIKKLFTELGVEVPGKTLDLTSLVGTQVKLRVTHETFEGEPQARIKSLSHAA